MYQQAEKIPTTDVQAVADFLGFMAGFSVLLHEHHDNEEEFFFPWIEEDLGVEPGSVMGDSVGQHKLFRAAVGVFDETVKKMRDGDEVYDAAKLLGLLDAFVKGPEGLYTHLAEEIAVFESLEKYDNKIDWKRWKKRVAKQAVDNGDQVRSNPLQG